MDPGEINSDGDLYEYNNDSDSDLYNYDNDSDSDLYNYDTESEIEIIYEQFNIVAHTNESSNIDDVQNESSNIDDAQNESSNIDDAPDEISNDETNERYEQLFALRFYYQDYIDDELEIIKLLKRNLIESNISIEDANTILKNFYNNYGINIDTNIIVNIQIEENIPFNNLNIPFNQLNIPINQLNIPLNQLNIQLNIPINIFNTIINNQLNNDYDNYDNEDNEDNIDNVNNDNHQHLDNNIFNFLSNIIYNNLNADTNLEQHQHTNNSNVVCTLDEEEHSKINKYTLDDDLLDKCNVCLDFMKKDQCVSCLPCKHNFHSECINEWLGNYNYNCPICRHEVGKPKYNL